MVPIVSIILASIASIALGFLWYGPFFGKQWMQLMGIKKKDPKKMKQEMPRAFTVMIISVLITAIILQVFIAITRQTTALGGAKIGFLAGFGFVMTTMASNYVFGGKSRGLYFIDAGYPLVNLTLMGLIIGALL